MKELKDILVAYQSGERGLPVYHELAAMVEASEPIIDGYPLWSGLPPPAERVALSDAQIKKIVIMAANEIYGEDDTQYTDEDAIFYGSFARAILAASTANDAQ